MRKEEKTVPRNGYHREEERWIVSGAMGGGDGLGSLHSGEGYSLSLYNLWNRDASESQMIDEPSVRNGS